MSAVVARVERLSDGTFWILAPLVGYVRDLPEVGALVHAGALATVEVLGRGRSLETPAGCEGRVVERAVPNEARAAVAYGTRLLRVDPRGAAVVGESAAVSAETTGSGLVFRAPMGGRFYAKPAPNKPALVQAGDLVTAGQGVCLLEVMKTFNRVVYGGAGLPDRAVVVRVVPADGDDVARGDALLELAPAAD